MPFACYLDVTIVLVHDRSGVSLDHMPLDWNSATSRRLPSRNRLFYTRHREAQLLWSKCRYVPAAWIVRHVFACYHSRRSPYAPLDTHFSFSPQSVTKSLAGINDPLSGATSTCETEPSRQVTRVSPLTGNPLPWPLSSTGFLLPAPFLRLLPLRACRIWISMIDVEIETPSEDQSRGVH